MTHHGALPLHVIKLMAMNDSQLREIDWDMDPGNEFNMLVDGQIAENTVPLLETLYTALLANLSVTSEEHNEYVHSVSSKLYDLYIAQDVYNRYCSVLTLIGDMHA
jgi:hypothetical protein